MDQKLNHKPVSFSRTVLSELMVPGYANFGGKVHGGTLLSMMDKVAYVCSSKHAGTYCVTVSVDTVNFLGPIEVGEMVSLYASVNHVGRSSLIVGIKVVAENIKNGTARHTNSSFFTMVAMGEDRQPVPVPGLILESEDDVRRFMEAKVRKEFKSQKGKELKAAIGALDFHEMRPALEDENCTINY